MLNRRQALEVVRQIGARGVVPPIKLNEAMLMKRVPGKLGDEEVYSYHKAGVTYMARISVCNGKVEADYKMW